MVVWRRSSAGQRGVSSVEYALIIALVAAVVIGSVAALGLVLPSLFEVVF